MSGFYVTMIFFGILLVLFSLLFIALDKKKVFNFSKKIDEKKQQLTEILNDAEQMIEELNNFSDYVVNQMDLKNEELNKNLKLAEEKVLALGERVKGISASAFIQSAANPAADGSPVQPAIAVKQAKKSVGSEAMIIKAEAAKPFETLETPETAAKFCSDANSEPVRYEEPTTVKTGKSAETINTTVKRKDKVIPLHNKYTEVLRLSQQGMESIDIARGLNMGKGEVELIIGLRSEQLQ
ncbi:MAG TPA: hypothetical protein VHT96_01870 [Clostridia bacterium]|nr:hypothetical protein [Clostridia bacterium]